MSPAGLILLAVIWSALIWGAAHLLCRFRPAPRTAQAIWRAAALLMFAPFAAALVVPGLPAFTAAPLPELPVLEPLFIQPDTDFIVAEAQASFRLPGIGLVLIALVAGGWAVRFALWLASQFRLQRLKARAEDLLATEEIGVLAGDWNVIPEGRDCHNPKAWEDDALFLPETRAAYRRILNLGFTDAVRAFDQNDGTYTFWDYQAGAWPKDHGIRIDHLLLTPQAADVLTGCGIDREIRGREKPSDHVPVWVELDA